MFDHSLRVVVPARSNVMSFNVHEQLESGIVTDDFARKSFTAFQF
jgi:hypothetical protein